MNALIEFIKVVCPQLKFDVMDSVELEGMMISCNESNWFMVNGSDGGYVRFIDEKNEVQRIHVEDLLNDNWRYRPQRSKSRGNLCRKYV